MILDKGCSSLRCYTAVTEVQLHVFELGLNVRYHAPSGARLMRTICDIESLLLTTDQCDYANSPHPFHSTLTSLFLPPVALQKG
ncbi:hypothetical protein T12_16642 [Trichinella patagoniensis]|uniref:Uncharacterized protein n=1 Tax=Trichinella patagoniensis TaxID=990121 RepID=A0A0V0YTS8_9BILA|nr:hypothetical protein T12_16642 [Trichinella patagoniensis]